MNSKKVLISLIVISIILSVVVTGVLFAFAFKQTPLPIYGQLANFTLTNQDGKMFDSAKLKNKIWVADFIFTTCGHICPIMSKNMAALHRSYLLEDDVEMVSISVNPEYDTPNVLNDYAKKYGADTKEWHFLTGQRENIKNIAVNGFKVGSVEEPVFHSPSFILVDRKAQIRGYYDGTTNKGVQKLFKDLAKLRKEK